MLRLHLNYKSLTCGENNCSLVMDLRENPRGAWKSVMIKVSLGHTDKADEGMIEVYDYSSGQDMPNPRNIFSGSILSLQRQSTKTLACNSEECLYQVCVARGWTEIIKEFDENYHPKTRIEWAPLITFDDLIRGNSVGPRLKFSYTIENGQISKLKVNPKVSYWSSCDQPNIAYGDDEFQEVPVQYTY